MEYCRNIGGFPGILWGPPEYWRNIWRSRVLQGNSKTEHPRNISPDIPRNMIKDTLLPKILAPNGRQGQPILRPANLYWGIVFNTVSWVGIRNIQPMYQHCRRAMTLTCFPGWIPLQPDKYVSLESISKLSGHELQHLDWLSCMLEVDLSNSRLLCSACTRYI